MVAKKPVVKKLIADTYLAVIKKSVGTRMFQDIYALVNGKRENVTRGGELSCAFFVSALLAMFGFIKECHGTVDATVDDLREAGWKRVKIPRPGDIVVWEKRDGHRHIGFSVGKDRAISNSSTKKYPVEHHGTFGSVQGKQKRRVEEIWRRVRIKQDRD